MQHLYIRRRFSSWSLQLRLSEGLLLSSAGLAIALLLYTAATSSAAASLKWKSTSSLSPIQLAISTPVASKAPLVSLTGEPRHYWVATAVAYRGLVAASPSPSLSEQEPSLDQASPAPANTVKATVHRSWAIIKLAFR